MAATLVIDDGLYTWEFVSTLLHNEGFPVREARNGREALQKLSEAKIDLCVLDLMMPEMDGFEPCGYARRYYEDLPILMLTAKGGISQKVKGFELGIDNYLTKPFEGAGLVSRVKALLRRYKIDASQTVQIDALTLDKDGHSVFCSGEQSDIPMKEFELLFKLDSSPGKTFAREQLIEGAWGYDSRGSERTLDAHINRLRERFPAERYQSKITTVRGLDYRLEVQK